MDEGNVGKRLDVDMQKEAILEKIKELKKQKIEERDNENIDIKYYEGCDLQIGKNKLRVSIAEINEKKLDENKEDKTIVTFDIYMKYKGEDVLIASINEQGDLNINRELLEKIDPENKLGLLELGEQEKPDLDKAIEGVEGKTEEELEAELGMKGKNGKNVDDETGDEEKEDGDKQKEDEEEKPRDIRRGLQELNLGVLILINPRLRECAKAYLDPSTNSLVFKDKFGKEHSPEEYGFEEKRVETGNFELTKMNGEGEVSSHENPTKVYAIKGSNYGISTDFKTHHREVNVIVKDREEGHANSYSIINGNLAKFDSGDISKYQGQERIGTREGWDAGNRDEANEEANELLEQLNEDDKKKFQEGFLDEVEDNQRLNDTEDLKRAVAKILEEEYHKSHEDSVEIATRIVDDGDMELAKEIVDETREEEQSSKREKGGRDIGEEAYERLHSKR